LPDPAIVASEQQAARITKCQGGTIAAAQCHQAADADARITSCEVDNCLERSAINVTPRPEADQVTWDFP
jgi:hypothetical protein